MNKIFVLGCKISFFFENLFSLLFKQKKVPYYYDISMEGKRYRRNNVTGVWEREFLKGTLRDPFFRKMYVECVSQWKPVLPSKARRLEQRMKKTS